MKKVKDPVDWSKWKDFRLQEIVKPLLKEDVKRSADLMSKKCMEVAKIYQEMYNIYEGADEDLNEKQPKNFQKLLTGSMDEVAMEWASMAKEWKKVK